MTLGFLYSWPRNAPPSAKERAVRVELVALAGEFMGRKIGPSYNDPALCRECFEGDEVVNPREGIELLEGAVNIAWNRYKADHGPLSPYVRRSTSTEMTETGVNVTLFVDDEPVDTEFVPFGVIGL